MDIAIIEKFFGMSFQKNDLSYSLEFISNNIIYYIELIQSENLVFFSATINTPDLAYPEFEYNITCDNFSLNTASTIGPVLLFSYNGTLNKAISITKTDQGFSISASL